MRTWARYSSARFAVLARETWPDLDEVRDVVRVHCGDVAAPSPYDGLGAFVRPDPSTFALPRSTRSTRATRSAAALRRGIRDLIRAEPEPREPPPHFAPSHPFIVQRFAPLFRFDYSPGPRFIFPSMAATTIAGAIAGAAVLQRYARPDQRTAYWIERRDQPATLDGWFLEWKRQG